MKREKYNLITGIFILVIFAIFVTSIIYFLQRNPYKNYYPVYTIYESVENIQTGIDVMIQGYSIGKVSRIEILKTPNIRFKIELMIRDEIALPLGTKCQLKSSGIFGDIYFNMMLPKTSRVNMTAGDYIVHKESEGLQFLIENISELLSYVRTILIDTSDALVDIRDIVKNNKSNISDSIVLLNDSVSKLNSILSLLDTDLRRNRKKVNSIVSDMSAISKNLNTVTKDLSELTEKSSGNIENVMKNLSGISDNLLKMSEDLKKNPWKLLRK